MQRRYTSAGLRGGGEVGVGGRRRWESWMEERGRGRRKGRGRGVREGGGGGGGEGEGQIKEC